MRPIIRDGTLVEVRPVAFHELAAGDIVAFRFAGEVYCHRLLRKSGRLCVLKGDRLLAADPPVVWSQIIGRVSRIVEAEEGQARLISLESASARRAAARRARLSYPLAVLMRLIAILRRCLEWNRGVRFDGE